jgi:hypothetical protein
MEKIALESIYIVVFATGFGQQAYHAHSKIKSFGVLREHADECRPWRNE